MADRPSKPADMPWLSPYLTVKDADAALAFYQRAFGLEKKMALAGPDGRTMHAEIRWRDAVVMFGSESPQHSCLAPVTMGVRPSVSLYLYCDDVDGLYRRALATGAKSESAPENKFYGDRVCGLLDPDGHLWYFATNVADFDPAKVPR
ncbi:MAG: VOC family protein [Planctomycetaceae bacterium]